MSGARRHVEVAYEAEDGAARGGGESAPAAGEGGGFVDAVVRFEDCAILPTGGDNCAIAKTLLAAGTRVRMPDGEEVVLAHSILEGHRCVCTWKGGGMGLLGVSEGGEGREELRAGSLPRAWRRMGS
jgi:hypothetical protein